MTMKKIRKTMKMEESMGKMRMRKMSRLKTLRVTD